MHLGESIIVGGSIGALTVQFTTGLLEFLLVMLPFTVIYLNIRCRLGEVK